MTVKTSDVERVAQYITARTRAKHEYTAKGMGHLVKRPITYGDVARVIGWAPNGIGPVLHALVEQYPITGCAMAASVRRKDGSIGDWQEHTHAKGKCPHAGPNAARKWLVAVVGEVR